MSRLGEKKLPSNVERLHSLRVRGPLEDWLARTEDDSQLPALVVARLPHPDRQDPASLSARLAAAAATARQVEHQDVLHCFGTVEIDSMTAQILELNTGIDLEQLLAFSRHQQTPLPPSLAVWILRHATSAVAHAHSLGIMHGALNPSIVLLLPNGEVKVDFGLIAAVGLVDDPAYTEQIDLRYTRPEWTAPEVEPHPVMDRWALAAMLLEALTGKAPGTAAFLPDQTDISLQAVPVPLRSCLGRAFDPEDLDYDVVRMTTELTRLFYTSLDAEDDADGRQLLQTWLERATATDPEVEGTVSDHADTVLPRRGAGEFTQALRAREGPVRPRDFSTDEFTPDVAQLARPDLAGDEGPTAPPTLAVPQVIPLPEVAPSEKATQPVRSEPDMEAPKLPARALGELLPAPPSSSSSSLSGIELRKPSRLTWFLAGFASTLVLLVVIRTVLGY